MAHRFPIAEIIESWGGNYTVQAEVVLSKYHYHQIRMKSWRGSSAQGWRRPRGDAPRHTFLTLHTSPCPRHHRSGLHHGHDQEEGGHDHSSSGVRRERCPGAADKATTRVNSEKVGEVRKYQNASHSLVLRGVNQAWGSSRAVRRWSGGRGVPAGSPHPSPPPWALLRRRRRVCKCGDAGQPDKRLRVPLSGASDVSICSAQCGSWPRPPALT